MYYKIEVYLLMQLFYISTALEIYITLPLICCLLLFKMFHEVLIVSSNN